MTAPLSGDSTGKQVGAESKTRHWAQINEASFVAGMRLLFWVCRVFGRWPFRVLLYPVLMWYLIAKPVARKTSQEYVQRLNAHGLNPPMKSGWLSAMRHFAAFAESILDKMLLWGGLFNTDEAVIFGADKVLADVVAKRGGLLVCSHLGNLDLCRVLSKKRANLKITVLVYHKHAQAFNQMLAQLDPDSQLNLMSVSEISPATAMVLAEKIANGEYIVIAGDRTPTSPNPRVAYAQFLGQSAPFPVGAYILASLLQCPVYLLFSIRVGQTSEIHIEPFRESIQLLRKNRDAALAELVADYALRLEYFCMRAPLQWFNFYDFWHLPIMDTPDAS